MFFYESNLLANNEGVANSHTCNKFAMEFDFQEILNRINSLSTLDRIEQSAFLEAKTPIPNGYNVSSLFGGNAILGDWYAYKPNKSPRLLRVILPREVKILKADDFYKIINFTSDNFTNNVHLELSCSLHEIAYNYLHDSISELEFNSLLEPLSLEQRTEVVKEIHRILHMYYILWLLERLLKTLLKAKYKFFRETATSLKKQKSILCKVKILFSPTKFIPDSIRPIELAA